MLVDMLLVVPVMWCSAVHMLRVPLKLARNGKEMRADNLHAKPARLGLAERAGLDRLEGRVAI